MPFVRSERISGIKRGGEAGAATTKRKPAAQGGDGVLAKRGREGGHHTFDLLLVAGAVAQEQQGAVEGIGVEFEQAGLVEEGAGFP